MSNDPENEDAKSRPRRIAVIGAGLSGLATAFRLSELSREFKSALDVTVFEAGSHVGGVIGTRRIEDYLVEMGSDSFITNKPWAIDLCKRLGLEEQLIPTDATYRRSLVLRNGRPVAVPAGFMLLSPAKIGPVLTSPIFSPWGKLRMGLEYFIPRKADNGDESLASFVRRRFGREALDRLVQPLVGGIYTSDPEKLSLKATLPRFLEMERTSRSLIRASRQSAATQTDEQRSDSGARYSLFLTLADGLSDLLETLVARVNQTGLIRLNRAVKTVEPANTNSSTTNSSTTNSSTRNSSTADSIGWKVTLGDGTSELFDGVIVALRTHHAAGLIRGFDARLSDALRGIEYASSAIVVSGHRLEDIRHPLDAFGLVIPAAEKREILAVSFSSRKFPGRAPQGRVLLRTFIGGAMQPEMMAKTDDELLAITHSELADLLGVTGKADFSVVARYENAMPQYHVGHLDRVEQIEQAAGGHRGFALAGNAYRGVGIPDCIHSGEQAAERVFGELSSVVH